MMRSLLRIVHVLAVGHWFGSSVFFTFVVGLLLFDTFGNLTALPRSERPWWLPIPAEVERPAPSSAFPEPLRREQGSYLAGAAVSAVFPWYYGLQMLCACVALVTACCWAPQGRLQQVRCLVVLLGLAGVTTGWVLEHQVDQLGDTRHSTTDAVLRGPSPSPDQVQAAQVARLQFSRWHGYSMLVNLATILAATLALGLAAFLPERNEQQAPGQSHVNPGSAVSQGGGERSCSGRGTAQ